jgi:hypothetical protein
MRRSGTGAPSTPSGRLRHHMMNPLKLTVNQAGRFEKTQYLVSDAEELPFMRGDPGSDYPIQPRSGMKIRALQNGTCRRIENEVHVQRSIPRV